MARTVTFEAKAVQSAIKITAVAYYRAGWDDATTVASVTKPADAESVSQMSSAVSGVHVDNPTFRAEGVFRNDPTWDSFMQSLEEYRNQADAFERGLD